MTQQMITIDDVTDADMELFSDMWKECYNYRPRFAYTKQDYVDLANQYDAIQTENRQLQNLRDEHGVNFTSLMHYYDWHLADIAAKSEQAAINRPGIKQIIDQWEHGLI